MRYYKKLLGDRIYLSPSNIEDAEKYLEWLSDFDTTDYLGRSASLINMQEEKAFLESQKNDDSNKLFAIVTLDEDKLIGNVGLHKIDPVNRTATLGIFIGDKDYRNNGYGTEAIRLVLDFAFNYLNLNNVDLTLMGFNDRAKKCYEKCGFKEFGRRRDSRFIDGKYYDCIYMDILAKEFNETYIRNKNI